MCKKHYRTEKFYRLCGKGNLEKVKRYYDKYHNRILIKKDLLCIVSFNGEPEMYNYIKLLSANDIEASHCFKIACYSNNLELAKHIIDRETIALSKNDCLNLFEWSFYKKYNEMNEWLFDQLMFNLDSEIKIE